MLRRWTVVSMSGAFVKIEAKSHAVGGWNFHLIFTPAYRAKVFTVLEVKELCRKVVREVAEKLGFRIEADEFGTDHWHLFVTGAKNFSAPQLVQRLKGATSRRVRQELVAKIKPYLWGDHFWSHGYFAETVGRVTSTTVRHYVEKSQQKHWPKKQAQTTLANFS